MQDPLSIPLSIDLFYNVVPLKYRRLKFGPYITSIAPKPKAHNGMTIFLLERILQVLNTNGGNCTLECVTECLCN